MQMDAWKHGSKESHQLVLVIEAKVVKWLEQAIADRLCNFIVEGDDLTFFEAANHLASRNSLSWEITLVVEDTWSQVKLANQFQFSFNWENRERNKSANELAEQAAKYFFEGVLFYYDILEPAKNSIYSNLWSSK